MSSLLRSEKVVQRDEQKVERKVVQKVVQKVERKASVTRSFAMQKISRRWEWM
ncbi:MAG: hypothetical protein IK131_03815 [Paludibacteraceae bacterium]|nr:hypothetical protein [Paludibacteraceae bacterium]